MATLIRKEPGAVVCDVGGWRSAATRQDQMKAETLAEWMASFPNAVANVAKSDLAEGPSSFAPLASLFEGGWTSSTSVIDGVRPVVEKSGINFVGVQTSIKGWQNHLAAALQKTEGKRTIALVDGVTADAEQIARAHPQLRLVVYRSNGAASAQKIMIGNVPLVSPGQKAKSLLRVELLANGEAAVTMLSLDDSVPDDPVSSELYKTYLGRVEEADLLSLVPRGKTGAFSGAEKCGSCHAKASEVWAKSHHSKAYETLVKTGNSRDPDCVSCHVVGLSSDKGFRSLKQTPTLAGVGCESCHGAGAEHSKAPSKVKLKKATLKDCASCHNSEHSVKFNASEFWTKIKH
jgi:hypothetical protein